MTIPRSMVGATFPTAPSVRIAKSRQFSMLNRRSNSCLRSPHKLKFAGTPLECGTKGNGKAGISETWEGFAYVLRDAK